MSMRAYARLGIAVILLGCLVGYANSAEPDAAARATLVEGNAALERANADPSQNLVAALLFAKALPAYEAAGDQETAAEIRSVLYWCKKRMDLASLERFVAAKGDEGQPLAAALAAVDQPPSASDAASFLSKAEAYAQKNPGQALKMAIRYFEVANRFQGTPESLRAQRLSLDALQQAMTNSGQADQAVATGIRSTPLASADLTEDARKAVQVSNQIADAIAVKVSRELGSERKRAVDAMLKEAEVAQRKGELEQMLAHQKQAADLDTEVKGISKPASTVLEGYRKARDKAITKAAAEVVVERRKLIQVLGRFQKDETKKGNTSGALAIKQAVDALAAQIEQSIAATPSALIAAPPPFDIRKATWSGNDVGPLAREVTEPVVAALLKGPLTLENKFFGFDPAPNAGKVLTVTFAKANGRIVTKSFPENTVINAALFAP